MVDIALVLIDFFLALLVGMLAAVLGIGGGAVNVPVLALLMGLDQGTAVGSSLAVIIFTSLAASLVYARQGLLLYKTALMLAPTAVLFSVGAALVSVVLPPPVLVALFALVLFLLAAGMWRPSLPLVVAVHRGPCYQEADADADGRREPLSVYTGHMLSWGAVSGCLNGFTGIGGGMINVPAIRSAGIPIHCTAATSALVVFCASVFSALAHCAVGHIAPLPVLAPYICGTVLGAAGGARIATRIPERLLTRGFAAFLVVMGAVMLVKAVTCF